MSKRDETSNQDTDVVIVGAGPVGCALAIDLAMAGVRTIVLESRSATERPHPGTNLTNMRSMEHLRRWDATEHVRAACRIGPEFARDAQFPTRANGYMVAKIPGAFSNMNPVPFASSVPQFGPQSSVERGLRDRLAELPAAQIRFDSAFVRFEQDANGVAVLYQCADGSERSVTGAYLVGADGSRSGVRRQLGIRLEGRRGLASGTAWYVRSPAIRDLLRQHHGQAVFVWFANEDGAGLLLIAQSSEGVFQYMDVSLEEGVDGGDWEQMRARLLRAIGAELPVEPIEGGAFQINSLVAPQFHLGRVFLAGESAHHISVYGAHGMNTGIGDAADLGWKLTAAIHGWAGPSLLDSYDAERVPLVSWVRDLTEQNTKHLARHCRPGMEKAGAAADALRAEIGAHIIADKRQEIISLGAQFGAAYYDSPIVVPDGTRPPQATFGEFVPSASPGARAPHVWLDTHRSLFDEIAHEGFTLLRLAPDCNTDGLEQAARERGVPLRVVTPNNASLEDLYGKTMALIRPDHYVAWRGSQPPPDPLAVIDVVRGAAPAQRER